MFISTNFRIGFKIRITIDVSLVQMCIVTLKLKELGCHEIFLKKE
jgi:hypothetical protein